MRSRRPQQLLAVDMELEGEQLGELEVRVREEPVRAVAMQLDDAVKVVVVVPDREHEHHRVSRRSRRPRSSSEGWFTTLDDASGIYCATD